MSVIIKGLDMPKSCVLCPLAHYNKFDELTGCEIVQGKRYIPHDDTEWWNNDNRPEWCPIIEIPKPHGAIVEVDVADTPVLLDAEE